MIGSTTGIYAARLLRGFSLVELLVVIVVISILAAISIVFYVNVREQAQATAVIAGLRQVDDAFTMWAVKDRLKEWPPDNNLGGGVPLSDLINQYPSLKMYLSTVPSVPGLHTEEWFYDNDVDSRTNCTNLYNGTNIVLRFVTSEKVARMVEDKMDDGDFLCGRIRYSENRIFFGISNSYRVEKM